MIEPNRSTPVSERTLSGQAGLHWRPTGASLSAELMASGLFSAQTWIDHSLWRPAALWAGIAGALATGTMLGTVDWRELALALILVDVLWGSVWRLAGGRGHLLSLGPRAQHQQVWLPYLQSGSPAARVFSGDHQDLWPIVFRVGVPAILLAVLAAAVLGVNALILTLIVMVATLVGWTVQHTFHGLPIVLYSLVSVGLPWMLVMQQMAQGRNELAWSENAILVAFWVVHHWGATRIVTDPRDAIAMLLLAGCEIGICILLIIVQAPLWLGVIVLLFLPAWLAIAQGYSVRGMQPLWLLALLMSALAMGQVR